MSRSTSELRVRVGAPLNKFNPPPPPPPVKYLTDRSNAEVLLWIIYVFSVLCLLCLCARLFICALWSPARKGLTSWLSFVVSACGLSLSNWYLGSVEVLDCIASLSLHPYLLLFVGLQKYLLHHFHFLNTRIRHL